MKKLKEFLELAGKFTSVFFPVAGALLAIASIFYNAWTIINLNPLKQSLDVMASDIQEIKKDLPNKVDRAEIVERDKITSDKLNYIIGKVDYLYQVHIK